MNTILQFIKGIFSPKVIIIILAICVVYFILPSGIKDVSNWFVSANTHRHLVNEHEKLSKLYEQQNRQLDSLLALTKKKDEQIAEIEARKINIEMKRSKLKQDLKNAKGNIVTLDSLANLIL